MMRKVLLLLVGFVLVGAGLSLAESYKQSIIIRAHVPQVQGLNVTISKVEPGKADDGGDLWTTADEMDFGELKLDKKNMIMLPSCYFAVDVGVLSNASDWSIKHKVSSIAGQGTNLDDNVNVTFVKQTANGSSPVGPGKVTYANSDGVVITKSQLSGGWLRIYYGIATGNTDSSKGATDAKGAKPITLNKPNGYYVGTVTLTLTVS